MFTTSLTSLALALTYFSTSILAAPTLSSTPSAPLAKRDWNIQLAIAQNFPDPSVFKDGPAGAWWAYASTNHAGINVQLATSSNFNSWSVLGYDALPTAGAWAYQPKPNVWAPNVIKNDAGLYVMYYSAALASNSALHCIGAATSTTPNGPFIPQSNYLACPGPGAIDPSSFHDADGTRWLVYKVDGNSQGHGGVCNNMVAPIQSTPIMLQQVAGDGTTLIGSPRQILDRSDLDGPLIEAPALAKATDGSGRYVLFFSSNCFTTANYDVSYAMANSIAGPYVKYGPFAVTGTNGLWAPGGAHVAVYDNVHMAFHAGQWGSRYMYTATIAVNSAQNLVTA